MRVVLHLTRHTFICMVLLQKVPKHLMNAYEEASSYVEDHFKHYWAKLRSINPP